MRGLRFAAAMIFAVAAAGSVGAAATPRVDQPLLTFAVDDWLGLCATDLQGHTFRLTDPRQSSLFASWSPDGRLLAYMDGYKRFVIVDAEGQVRRSSTWTGNSGVAALVWSPDGREFASVGYWGIYTWLSVINADGTRGSTIVEGASGQPSWSPDGARILFSMSSAAYVVDSSGANKTKLIDDASESVWSPDGGKIAYVGLAPNGKHVSLGVAQADGSEPHALAQGEISSPAWSPDGSTIAFSRLVGTSFEVVLIKPDGTDEHTIALGRGPVWAPDGSWVAFASPAEASWQSQTAVVRPDGTDEHIIETGLPGALTTAQFWRRSAPLPSHRRPCVFQGTARADVIRGTNRADVLFGDAGEDRIYGAGGNDVLFGDAGRDAIYGAKGKDILIGGPGHDRLFGGPGNDFFETKDGVRDYLFGGPGSDRGSYDLYEDRIKSVEHYAGG